jgi:hypothetical protein
MVKGKKKLTGRVRNLVVISTLAAIVLSASTYAWFIGMRTVNVSSFDIEIASTDSLLLSLDGETWDTTVTISGDTYNQTGEEDGEDQIVYIGNTNNWGAPGLIPMSTIGIMDTAASRMILFEKASLTATPGGYRLMSSRVDNHTAGQPEKKGYVVFDLFVKNFSGTQYIPALNTLDEEAIYLTVDSSVTVANGGVDNTGIENSVRVAFTQVGRVVATTTTPSTITGITCAPDEEGIPSVIGEVTGICRKAQIWEPNDTKHVANAISWYNTSCKERTGLDVTDTDSYTVNSCSLIKDTFTYPTYAVGSEIDSTDNVDVYDGLEYNKYISSALLVKNPTFTDTYKDKLGTTRPLFMTLAPNSITKVRIYVYIEGQDIDNYDFASIGKRIAVKFGFTKERFEGSDIHYDENEGPIMNPGTDTTKPIITLLGDPAVTVPLDGTYVDEGATASDNIDGDMTTKIHTTNPVDETVAGVYYVTYDVSDWAGNYAARVTRKVTVGPVTP